MTKKITLALFLLLLLTSCVEVSRESPTSTPVAFATSALATAAPPTASPTVEPSPTNTASACEDNAVLVEDVTYPDNTRLTAGEKFTKTWKLQNTGTCTWTGYTVAFFSGDKMEAPNSVPVPETKAKASVEVSVDLVAPLDDGMYVGNFELRDAAGASVPLGTEPTFWVKIVVGESPLSSSIEQTTGDCTYTESPEYVNQLIDLINKARGEAGRKALTINDKLTTAAQAHSLDMACNSTRFLEHSGSDGLWTGERLTKVGYTKTYYFELLAIGLPQDAINEWRRHDNMWPAVIDAYVTEMGVGYVYSRLSTYGGYWTVIVGGP